MAISVQDLYWTAGFLEGDGCFPLLKDRSLGVAAVQVQRWPLEKLQRLYGGRITLRQPSNPNCNIQNVWHLSTIKAAGLMMTLYPLMSEKRKFQIAIALAGWKQKRVCRRHLSNKKNRGVELK